MLTGVACFYIADYYYYMLYGYNIIYQSYYIGIRTQTSHTRYVLCACAVLPTVDNLDVRM